jgi:hypothetical protein
MWVGFSPDVWEFQIAPVPRGCWETRISKNCGTGRFCGSLPPPSKTAYLPSAQNLDKRAQASLRTSKLAALQRLRLTIQNSPGPGNFLCFETAPGNRGLLWISHRSDIRRFTGVKDDEVYDQQHRAGNHRSKHQLLDGDEGEKQKDAEAGISYFAVCPG